MATRISSKTAKPKRAQPNVAAGADDVNVLHPDITLTIAGRTVTIREYRFVNGLSVRAKALPFTRALQAQIESGSAVTEDILDVMAAQQELVRELILDAIEGSDAEPARAEIEQWIVGLDDEPGELLMLTWWGVCGPFFVRQVARRIGQRIELQKDLLKLRQARDGATSTPALPPLATATPSSSAADTPSAS